jgi:prevent-host-death family protein
MMGFIYCRAGTAVMELRSTLPLMRGVTDGRDTKRPRKNPRVSAGKRCRAAAIFPRPARVSGLRDDRADSDQTAGHRQPAAVAAVLRGDYNDHMITNLRDAKAHLSLLVQRAAGGEEVIITVRGKPAARLTGLASPVASARDVRAWLSELADEAEAARSGELRSTPQEVWDGLRAERG